MTSKSLLREVLEENSKENDYDPNIEYYSVDYHCTKDIRWVRNSFIKLEDLRWYGVNGLAKGESVYQTAKDFRVLPEKWLTQPRKHWIAEIKSYVPDFITNRQFIFDNRYEDSAVLNTGQQSLSQLVEDKETQEEWFNRIKEDPRMKDKFLKKGFGERKYSDGEYSHLSFVDGKWVKV